MTLLGVLIAGALGAPARYLLEQAVRRTHHVFPWGTFVVNVTGSLALGVLTGLVVAHGFPDQARVVIGTGFLGAYTTFSAYAYEIVRRTEAGNAGTAGVYALASLVVGIGAAAAGLAITGAL